MKEFMICFNLHDGEGGTGGATGTEASAFLASLPGGNKEQADGGSSEQRIEYGRQDPSDSQARVGGEQNGSADGSAQDLEAEWAELIGKGGRFHDLYGQNVSEAIQNRFKNSADYQGQVAGYEQALSPLLQKYGLKAGDIEGLTHAIENDMDIYTGAAEEEGISPEQYLENLKLRADAQRGREMMEAYQQQVQRNQKYGQWEAEAYNLQQTFPAFDLGQEIQSNERFASLLDNGFGVEEAFMATHIQEIMTGMNGEATRAARAQTVQNIQQRAARPMENGLRNNPAVVRKSDPSKFTNDDIDEILRRVEAGERFYF